MWCYLKLMIWAMIWLVVGSVVMLWRRISKTTKTNCVLYAIERWEKEPNGYLVIRWCRSSKTRFKWPHFLFLDPSDNKDLQHCMPSTDYTQHHWTPDLLFNGKVYRGDDPAGGHLEN